MSGSLTISTSGTPGAVVVDQRVVGGVDAPARPDVGELARVLLHVGPRHADPEPVGQLEPAPAVQRLVVLADLVVLGLVRVEVVLPGELEGRISQCSAAPIRMASSTACSLRTGSEPGQAEADRADVDVGLVAERVAAPAEQLGLRLQLAVHLEPDDHLPVRAHDPVSCGAWASTDAGHPEQDAPRRAPAPAPAPRRAGRRRPVPKGTETAGCPEQVGGDGAHVVHVHGHGVVHLVPEVEGRRGRGGAEQHVDRLVGAVEGPHHQRAHPLGLRVVRVVVAGGQRVGAEHHPALHLGAEAGRAGRGVHGGHVLAVDPQPVADAVVAGQVGGRLRRRDEVVGRQAVGELGHRRSPPPSPRRRPGRRPPPAPAPPRRARSRRRGRGTARRATPSAPPCTEARVGSGADGSDVLSRGSCPARTSKRSAASSTVVANGPIWSSELAKATRP